MYFFHTNVTSYCTALIQGQVHSYLEAGTQGMLFVMCSNCWATNHINNTVCIATPDF